MKIRLHLFIHFLIDLGVCLGLIAWMVAYNAVSLVTLLAAFTASGLAGFMFGRLVPAKCEACNQITAYKNIGLGASIYHCKTCSNTTRTNISFGNNGSTQVSHDYAQNKIKQNTTKSKVSLKKSWIRRLWD